jgi:hypothetical protein
MTKPEQEQCSKGNENDQICADRHQARRGSIADDRGLLARLASAVSDTSADPSIGVGYLA